MKTGIEKFKEIIDDETCNLLIEYIENNLNICDDLNWCNESRNNVICKQIFLQKETDLDSQVYKAINNVVSKYTDLYSHFHATGDTGYALRKITGETRIHVDTMTKDFRNISIILGLNSDYEKGEFNFPYQNFSTTVKRGEAIVFPVYFMYPHHVDAPIGNRYTINTWMQESF